uniref:Transcription initiation factor TFIID subunit 7-like n=1 Tax=Actinia tenebrosa TaxID=6105 RepID=A0A6P8IDU8_ACTTE
MSSKVKSYESGVLENQFILRLPQKQADFVRNALTAGTLKDKLSIEFQADNRYATVRVNGEALSSKLVDLPCLIESHKTLDCKSFYKTADVCQLLVCSNGDHDSPEDENKHHKKESKKFIWNHGITPPLKNGRKRRFRKMAKKKVSESPEIEKEVKRLLRTDLSATTVTFEVLNDEEKPDDSQNINLPTDAELSVNSLSLRNDDLSQMTTASDDEERNELFKLLQEASSDEDEEDDQDQSQENYDDDVDVEGDDNDEFDEGLKSQLEDAREKLEEIRSSKAQQIARVSGAANPFLKERFQKILEDILRQEKEQEEELEKLENELKETS